LTFDGQYSPNGTCSDYTFQGNKATEWGNYWETIARQKSSEKLKLESFEIGLFSIYDRLIGSPDGVMQNGILEIKCPYEPVNHVKNLYILDAEYTLVATTDTITVRSLSTGIETKLAVGNTLTATAPIALVNKSAEVTAETVEPSAAETLEDYRTKALDAYRLEPQGGAATDYRLWAADAQGVKQTYAYAKSGTDYQINLYVEATIADSTDGKGTPSALLLAEVEEVVEFDPDDTRPDEERGRRPLQAIVNFLPVSIREVDIVINGLVGRTTDIENLIIDALTAEINKVRPFVSACDVLADKNDILDNNKIIATILNTRPGSVFGAITLQVDSTTYSSFTFVNGFIPHVNSITFA